jgi:hypothetical protein
MAWQAVEADEWEALLTANNVSQVKGQHSQELPANVIKMPPAVISTDGLSAESLKQLAAQIKGIEQRDGKLTLERIIGTPPPPPPPARLRRLNALCDELLCAAMVAEINGKARRKGRHVTKKEQGKKCGNSWISAWKKCDAGVDSGASAQQIKRDEDHRIQPQDWEEHHSRADARRAGDAGEDAARRILPRHYELQAGPTARATGAEISAVALGKKPLFHDQWNEASDHMAAALKGRLPKGVQAESFDGHLVVYRESVVRKVMDSDPSFYRHDKEGVPAAIRRVVKDQAMGELLGYGQRTMAGGGKRVIFFTHDDGLLAGFIPPAKGADAFVESRRADYQRRLKRPVKIATL